MRETAERNDELDENFRWSA